MSYKIVHANIFLNNIIFSNYILLTFYDLAFNHIYVIMSGVFSGTADVMSINPRGPGILRILFNGERTSFVHSMREEMFLHFL